MQRIRNLRQPITDTGGKAVDGNRLYSILLDARASKMSENMFDVSENLVSSEKENAKAALEQLWALKRNMQQEHDTGTVDLLIKYYQEKLNVLREKEESIKKVSKDSRTLLEEKRKRDGEIAFVKQEIVDCSQEIERLNDKLGKLKVKEQELSLIDTQVSKELSTNANEIVNGLYEIILAQQNYGVENESDSMPVNPPPETTTSNEIEGNEDKKAAETCEEDTKGVEIIGERRNEESGGGGDEEVVLLQRPEKKPTPALPKAVVKTTRGIVIGEYYYDAQAYKTERVYIFNSDFIQDKLLSTIRSLRQKFERDRFGEAVQMVHDAYRRIGNSDNIYFEVATNEILGMETLKDMYYNLKERRYDEVVAICNKLKSKIEALGSNYSELLIEQMKRLTES